MRCYRTVLIYALMTACPHLHVSHGSCAEEDLGGHTVAVLPGAVGTKVWWRLEGGPGGKGHNDHRIA